MDEFKTYQDIAKNRIELLERYINHLKKSHVRKGLSIFSKELDKLTVKHNKDKGFKYTVYIWKETFFINEKTELIKMLEGLKSKFIENINFVAQKNINQYNDWMNNRLEMQKCREIINSI